MHTSLYMILYICLRHKHCKSFTWGSPQPRAQLYWREGLGHTRSQKATAGKLFFNALFCRYHKIHLFKHLCWPIISNLLLRHHKSIFFAIWRLTCFSIVFTHSARSLSGKKTQDGSSSTPIRASSIAWILTIWNLVTWRRRTKIKTTKKVDSDLFVGERSLSGSRQAFPLLLLPLVAKNAGKKSWYIWVRYYLSRIQDILNMLFIYMQCCFGSPEKKRCDHPPNGEVVIAEHVNTEPGKAVMNNL